MVLKAGSDARGDRDRVRNQRLSRHVASRSSCPILWSHTRNSALIHATSIIPSGVTVDSFLTIMLERQMDVNKRSRYTGSINVDTISFIPIHRCNDLLDSMNTTCRANDPETDVLYANIPDADDDFGDAVPDADDDFDDAVFDADDDFGDAVPDADDDFDDAVFDASTLMRVMMILM